MEDELVGPGHIYQDVFGKMETVLDNLKVLNYETEFVRKQGFKSLSRHYFAIPTNPGEQFYTFTSLAVWLLNKLGNHLDMPNEYDDPNATISMILEEAKQLNIVVDFPPAKLKSGCGEQVLAVLDKLCFHCIERIEFSFDAPQYPDDLEDEDEQVVQEDAELKIDKIEEEMLDEDDEIDDEDDNFLDLEGLKNMSATDGFRSKKDLIGRQEVILESTTDASEWKLEVERVTPSLKVHIRTDNKDWRTHVDQMHQHQHSIDSSLVETKIHLDKLHTDVTRTLEKISSREKYLNNQLEHLLNEFRAMQDRLAETRERYRQASSGVTNRSRLLAEITEELDRVKQEMDERGSSMTDGAPLVKIKQALSRLKNELTQMDIRIGVLQHILLQAKLKERTNMTRDARHVYDEQEVKFGRQLILT